MIGIRFRSGLGQGQGLVGVKVRGWLGSKSGLVGRVGVKVGQG